MLIVVSPAKKLNLETKAPTKKKSSASFLSESEVLINHLQEFSTEQLSSLMSISDKLAELNRERYYNWQLPFSLDNAKQALFAFNGDVYRGLDAESFNAKEIQFAQRHFRIISGLYGILKPLDLIQAYRLEMGTKLKIGKHNNLYEFWGNKISHQINKELKKHEHPILINLASNEYFKSIAGKIDYQVISPVFKDNKNGQYKIISIYAKRARGLMSRFLIQNKIDDPKQLNDFNLEGYSYNKKLSTENAPIFLRKS